jgi:STE24 endopeptidase
VATTALLLAALVVSGGSSRLRDAVGGSVSSYVVLLALLHAIATFPFAWYRGYRLERQYELSQMSVAVWLRDCLKARALGIALAVAAAEYAYLAMRVSPAWWWVATAVAGTALLGLLTWLTPVLVLPLFHPSRSLDRERLRQRLLDLSARAGVSVLNVHELRLGEKTRRANAALAGAGATRRILISDTLLAEYTDDEIEVIMAHEIGHHVHRDVMKGLAVEFLVLMACSYAGSVALRGSWQWLGLLSLHDVAGLPVVLLAAGSVSLAITPLLNAWSRHNERRADGFALKLTSRPDAFVAAMRRMAAQNLAEEHPTFAARWLFNTHPTVDERIARARGLIAAQAHARSRDVAKPVAEGAGCGALE